MSCSSGIDGDASLARGREAQPESMPRLTLFTHKKCPFAQRAWIALLLSQLPFRLEEVDLYGRLSERFIAVSPKKQVPVLVVASELRAGCESSVANGGDDLENSRQNKAHASDSLIAADSPATTVSAAVPESEDILEAIAQLRGSKIGAGPQVERAWFRKFVNGPLNKAGYSAARGDMDAATRCLNVIEQRLAARETTSTEHGGEGGTTGGHKRDSGERASGVDRAAGGLNPRTVFFLGGTAEPTIIDASAFPFIHRLYCQSPQTLLKGLPRVRHWYSAMSENTAVARTLVADWWWWW